MDFDPLAIQTLGASLKTIVDIAKGIREAKSTAETESKVTALQAALLGRSKFGPLSDKCSVRIT